MTIATVSAFVSFGDRPDAAFRWRT